MGTSNKNMNMPKKMSPMPMMNQNKMPMSGSVAKKTYKKSTKSAPANKAHTKNPTK